MVLLPEVRHARLILTKIQILQKRALRLVYFADWHDHAMPDALPTTFLYHESVLASMQDINNNNKAGKHFRKRLIFILTIQHQSMSGRKNLR